MSTGAHRVDTQEMDGKTRLSLTSHPCLYAYVGGPHRDSGCRAPRTHGRHLLPYLMRDVPMLAGGGAPTGSVGESLSDAIMVPQYRQLRPQDNIEVPGTDAPRGSSAQAPSTTLKFVALVAPTVALIFISLGGASDCFTRPPRVVRRPL